MKKNRSSKKETVKPPAHLLGNIMKRVKGLDTPEKKKKETIRLITKYFIMEYRPNLHKIFKDRFDNFYEDIQEADSRFKETASYRFGEELVALEETTDETSLPEISRLPLPDKHTRLKNIIRLFCLLEKSPDICEQMINQDMDISLINSAKQFIKQLAIRK